MNQRGIRIILFSFQAQVVLQGKSRSVIIRELQRTNLDVNLAVNNLLSRDDEDGDDGDDTASESYLPGGWWITIMVFSSLKGKVAFKLEWNFKVQ